MKKKINKDMKRHEITVETKFILEKDSLKFLNAFFCAHKQGHHL